MKNTVKYLIIVCLLGLSVNTFAQATFGVKAGLNLSNMVWEDDDYTYSDEMNFTMKPGFNFGPTSVSYTHLDVYKRQNSAR